AARGLLRRGLRRFGAQPLHQPLARGGPPPPPPPRVLAGAAVAAAAAPVLQAPPPPPPEEPLASEADQLLKALEVEGMHAGLLRRWEQVEALHGDGRFTCEQVARLFSRCGAIFSSYTPVRRAAGTALPLNLRLVQLFSNYVCERIPELTPEQITIFVVSLTSSAQAMDEFWLFMLAKRIQDTASQFSTSQVVTIARRYADRELEDGEFFGALSQRVRDSLEEFTLPERADFLLSCAKLKFLDEDLCAAALPSFSDPSQVAGLDGKCLGAALTAAAQLDRSAFLPRASCRTLAARPLELRRAVNSADLMMGAALAVVQLRHPAGIVELLPHLLSCLSAAFAKRRVTLLGLCMAFGLPSTGAWPLPLLQGTAHTHEALRRQAVLRASPRDLWEPTPSSFHLEVVAVLRIRRRTDAINRNLWRSARISWICAGAPLGGAYGAAPWRARSAPGAGGGPAQTQEIRAERNRFFFRIPS
ncbi:unnamed protein product, partial [Prorocentrum cordatum]